MEFFRCYILRNKPDVRSFHPYKFKQKNLIFGSTRFKIILEEDEEVGGFIASCPGLPDCISQGDIVEEAVENIKEAIQVCLESFAEDEL